MNKHLHCPDENHVCQHGEDESCPAMNPPESETPLVERLMKAQWDEATCRHDFNTAIQAGAPVHILEMIEDISRLCGEAATALSLAQTQIKGHMRVEDELKEKLANAEADLADEAPARFQLQGALKRAQDEWQKAQARIAELEKAVLGECEECGHIIITPLHHLPSVEKDAARYRWLRSKKAIDSELFIGHYGPSIARLTDHFADAAIDAALRDRA